RYDRLMQLGWKVMFPLGLLNAVITAFVVVWVGG
ncbi:MAG: NADH-quinone oxidoreductase subunit H, partial [Thermanaerothrix sp.]|nr:NADH-quinone oxidoreductase subunit H [Thermanaerothrix sp.]